MTLVLLAAVLAVTIPPVNDSRVVDQAGLLTDAQNTEVAAVIRDVEARQGVKLGVLTLTDLDDEPKATAVRTLNFWEVGPDSILLLVSMNPRKIFLQPGTNLAYRFTEAKSVAIIRDNIVPALKSGRYGAGILNGVHAISNNLPGPAVSPPNTRQRPEPTPVALAPVVATVEGPGFIQNHPFLTFLILSGLILGFILAVRYVLRKRREEAEAKESFQRQQRALRPSTFDPETGLPPSRGITARSTGAPVQGAGVVGNGGGGTTVVNTGGNDLLTGVFIGQAISQPAPAMAAPVYIPTPAPRYSPPPAPPTPPRRSSSRSSDGDGGGGSSWGSSSSYSSDSSGGGGYDSGGGSSDGGGGGGSDF